MGQLKRGDIFFADLGHKVRPYLVVQNDVGNHYSQRTIVVPLTSKFKKSLPTHCCVCWGKIRASVIHCEELMCIPMDDGWDAVEHLPPEIMRHVDECLKIAIGLE